MINKLATYACVLTLLAFFSISTAHAEKADMRHTYAVVWIQDTNDAMLYNDTIAEQGKQMLELWTNGTIENVYLDTKKTPQDVQKGKIAPVTFFIKASTEDEAKKILDKMALVEKKLAKYELHSVGLLWLK